MSNKDNNQISLMSLYQVGAHRGNKKSRLNPKLKSSIYGIKDGLCLIDLAKTQNTLAKVEDFLFNLGSKKKQVLVVGTSKHLKHLVAPFSEKFVTGQMPYVNSRWLGGTLTNWLTIKKTLKTLEKLNKILENKEFYEKLSKNEQLNIVREKEKISKFFEGLAHLKTNKPSAIIILNASDDSIAIKEAELVGIPVITLTHTSALALPHNLDMTIVTNVYSINNVELILQRMVDSYNRGAINSANVEVIDQTKITAKV
jgi:small subunit ribosomal protein S2